MRWNELSEFVIKRFYCSCTKCPYFVCYLVVIYFCIYCWTRKKTWQMGPCLSGMYYRLLGQTRCIYVFNVSKVTYIVQDISVMCMTCNISTNCTLCVLLYWHNYTMLHKSLANNFIFIIIYNFIFIRIILKILIVFKSHIREYKHNDYLW